MCGTVVVVVVAEGLVVAVAAAPEPVVVTAGIAVVPAPLGELDPGPLVLEAGLTPVLVGGAVLVGRAVLVAEALPVEVVLPVGAVVVVVVEVVVVGGPFGGGSPRVAGLMGSRGQVMPSSPDRLAKASVHELTAWCRCPTVLLWAPTAKRPAGTGSNWLTVLFWKASTLDVCQEAPSVDVSTATELLALPRT
jgi:hypothetical protein